MGSVKGLVGHLGCIAFNALDGKVYGSLEFKNDAIGKGILKSIGYTGEIKDGFYIACFDVEKINRLDMDAERDGVMRAVFLQEVYDDYSADGHRLGCSGIDGTTFAPAIGETGEANRLYVAYGVYGDTTRDDNDHQVILQYDISNWDTYAQPLNQLNMHRCGPVNPDAKYFVYTGNTSWGIQNLEYDPYTGDLFAAVYKGQKPQFPNYSMFVIKGAQTPVWEELAGYGGEMGKVLALKGEGNDFSYGSTGIISLGDGRFYFSEDYHNPEEKCWGSEICMYRYTGDEKMPFQKIEEN